LLAMRAYAQAATALASDPGSRVLGYSSNLGESQVEIWAKVKQTQDELARNVGAPVAAPASPSSLQLSLENEKLKEVQTAYIGALQGAGTSADDIVGYVVAINGKIASADVYRSNALFRKVWPKLLAANVTEAIAKKDGAGVGQPSVTDVDAFLSAIAAAPESERAINAGVRLATREVKTALYAETRRGDESWVHRNYLAR
jgi:hypothetical protein